MIDVLNKIASALGRRDEMPNQELAREIAALGDREAIELLVNSLTREKQTVKNDCIKVLYEIGGIDPNLIGPYLDNFLALLSSKNNRLQWGAMTALAEIARINPGGLFPHLPVILDAADRGSVITRDQSVNILIALMGHPEFAKDSAFLFSEQLAKSPDQQFSMYAERAFPALPKTSYPNFLKLLNERLPSLTKDSQKKRLTRLIKKVQA